MEEEREGRKEGGVRLRDGGRGKEGRKELGRELGKEGSIDVEGIR